MCHAKARRLADIAFVPPVSLHPTCLHPTGHPYTRSRCYKSLSPYLHWYRAGMKTGPYTRSSRPESVFLESRAACRPSSPVRTNRRAVGVSCAQHDPTVVNTSALSASLLALYSPYFFRVSSSFCSASPSSCHFAAVCCSTAAVSAASVGRVLGMVMILAKLRLAMSVISSKA